MVCKQPANAPQATKGDTRGPAQRLNEIRILDDDTQGPKKIQDMNVGK